MSYSLHNLKDSIEESKLTRLIEETIRQLEKGTYIELRGSILDEYIKKILFNTAKIKEIINDFLLNNRLSSKIKNILFNDTFGALHQLKVELLNRFYCEEIKISVSKKVILDW